MSPKAVNVVANVAGEVADGFAAIQEWRDDGSLTPAAAAILQEKQARDLERLLDIAGQSRLCSQSTSMWGTAL